MGLVALDRKKQTLAQNESMTLAVPTAAALSVRYFANFVSGGTVDASVQPRGSMYQQGAPDPAWYDPTPSTVSAEGDENQSLNEWPFAQTALVITNNSADDLVVDAGLIARD
jgi:hypothetical protein